MKLYFRFKNYSIGIVKDREHSGLYKVILNLPIRMVYASEVLALMDSLDFISLDKYPWDIQVIRGEIGCDRRYRVLVFGGK